MDSGAEHAVLEVEGLTYGVPGRTLLDGVSLRIAAGESVAVMGASGSGKSTLLMCVLGLLRPRSGVVRVAGVDQGRLSRAALARHRRDTIGMVFQFGELLSELTPVENVALAGLLAGKRGAEAHREAAELLAELGVPQDAATGTLSGGERQRAAVARALVNEPTLLLADEPTGSLDARHRDAVADLLYRLPRQRGCGLLLVTHDSDVARRADRCVQLLGGAIVEKAPAGDPL
ncbi:ABC transporter ATP-binding protein [Streptomyces sp. NPDC052225]|uniref:ABC transporter ATP-binding protein n=1 Tax=Streptomyces sp. NPDC052225 TaxID=3154949 RepID=UPI00344427FF